MSADAASGPTTSEGEAIERSFIRVTWQKGLPDDVGINGCRVDDVLTLASDKLQQYQSGPLACEENAEALLALTTALNAMETRRKRRQEQGVLNTMTAHETERTEDVEQDFSATGA